ncbi:aquaporin-like protein [Amniculicola lignicola CBS 123094]|uniref:Aquaporin-like protein n=1 Tax=Amniculicola lignicola CBS 123094 TaxID=1392246 RepID=A0A6A5WIV8_9PLEO|nr:aquaporin-like protein [Amniculicola lignicola CBS 123094]
MVLPGMKPTYTSDPKHTGERRSTGLEWLPNRLRHLLISMLGEFVGTYLFLFFAFAGTQVANTPPSEADAPPSASALLYISLAFGFSLAVNVWIFFRISGGLFNPAVTVALALVGAIEWLKASLLILSQVLGGIAAAGIVSALLPGPLAVRTSLNPDTSVVRGLFIETLLTSELIFAIFMLAAEKHKATFLAPIGIGLALFIAELAGVYFTGGSLNPARSFGPDVVLATFDSYHWIYWVGPLLGAIIAVVFYRLIKALEYETANPGADGDGRDTHTTPETPAEDPRRDGNVARRTTDGTDESDFLPPIHPINERLQERRPTTSFLYNTTSASSVPNPPQPIFRLGGDAHHSHTSINHPNNRPRAQHRGSSFSSRMHSAEQESDHSYRSAPSAESGSISHSSRSST